MEMERDFKPADPFLMVGFHHDRFPPRSTLRNTPGFPQHPHCGFETLTVTFPSDAMTDHADSEGGRGRYGDGDVQWMSAGRGMAHSEMVALKSADADNIGMVFQLWLNQPEKAKKAAPFTRMLWHEDVPKTRAGPGCGQVTAIAGPDATVAPPPDSWAADPANAVRVEVLTLEPGESLDVVKADAASNLRLYPFVVEPGAKLVVSCGEDTTEVTKADGRVTLALRDSAKIANAGAAGTIKVLRLEARPIDEPVFSSGPFVAASQADLDAAFSDYQRGALVPKWPWQDEGPTHDNERRFYEHPGGREERGDPISIPRPGPAAYLPSMGIVRPLS